MSSGVTEWFDEHKQWLKNKQNICYVLCREEISISVDLGTHMMDSVLHHQTTNFFGKKKKKRERERERLLIIASDILLHTGGTKP